MQSTCFLFMRSSDSGAASSSLPKAYSRPLRFASPVTRPNDSDCTIQMALRTPPPAAPPTSPTLHVSWVVPRCSNSSFYWKLKRLLQRKSDSRPSGVFTHFRWECYSCFTEVKQQQQGKLTPGMNNSSSMLYLYGIILNCFMVETRLLTWSWGHLRRVLE